MKNPCVSLGFISLARRALMAGVINLILAHLPALATTFTNDTAINANNMNYEGADIIVTNCTVTVDGPHAFSSLLVTAGGVLTHSFSPVGVISNLLSVANESQVLNSTNPVTLLNSNIITASVLVTDSGSTIIYTNGVDYLLTSPDGILTQLQRTTNSTIPDGANVLVSYTALLGVLPAGFNLSVTGNVAVASGGAINANGKGYGGGAGPGAGCGAGSPADGSGAGYGGNGGMSSSNAVGGAVYGSFAQPTNSGSGGGASYAGIGGAGGGTIQITAGGIFTINGTISADGANGTNSRSGGGAGGSIWITAHLVSGSGAISAQGGTGEPTHGGGGGGGRIAIQSDVNSFTGSLAAQGGAGAKTGGAGTTYTQVTGQNGLLVFDNAGQTGTNSLVAISSSSVDVLVRGNAVVVPSGAWTIGNLTIASNGMLLASSALSPVNLNASGNVTIQAGGSLLADSAGYAAGMGSGYGHYDYVTGYPGGGGGHGGSGANGTSTIASGGMAYGSQTSPTTFGSGGGTYPVYSVGGAGGGAVQISVSGILQVDGCISANGGSGSGTGGGGGSGGSIWLTSGILIGSGSITANGGSSAGSIGGGGGGGRIAIYPAANLFGGVMSAYGGSGASSGGAGTVFLQPTGQNGQLILDDGGNAGTNTPVQSASTADLIVRNGASASASSSASFANLLMSSNAWLTAYSYSSSAPAYPVNFSFSGNATIPGGCGIFTDVMGYPGGQGSGAGRNYSSLSTYPCSGAGHGGYGANSTGNYAIGGNTYDLITSPTGYGSGGGNYSPYSFGGSGGGAVRLTVTGTLQMDGTISANGGNGSGTGGGGGSGGSVWLTVGTLSGAGAITANGGSGVDSVGGGGGGGIIYVSCNNNFFAGNASAFGGGGANWGGAGTVLIQPYGQNGQLVLDNGGHPGISALQQPASTADLTLRNGAIGLISGPVTFGNLLVSSNAWLLITNSGYATTLSSATIQAGGGIIADAFGYPSGQGPGAGQTYYYNSTYVGGGAGHGGYGATSYGNYAGGGTTYDSITSPTGYGSGGGAYSSSYPGIGGAGGGAIRLSLKGTLQVAGVISANGGNGSVSGGGGSGGSILLTVGTLSGNGSITANGGSGADSLGGGGGGGRIYVSCSNNSFTGTLVAYGGGGANWGGAGTVLIQTTGLNYQQVLDNGGHAGAGTLLQSVSPMDLTLRNGAIGLLPGSLSFASLLVNSNGWLVISNSSYSYTLTVSSATIQAGGGILADAAGYAAGQGSGAGRYYNNNSIYLCSGAGHGGCGANSSGNFAPGGIAYDSTTSPLNPGSGGGSYSPYSIGGAGGGAIRLNVSGILQADGRISANGGNGSGSGGGGGSGGSIWLTVGTLSGAGSITANGGSGADSIGGGGGGGRIAIYYNNNSFTGPVSAYGGGGAGWGGAGTVYLLANSQGYGQLTLDNGGNTGTNTTFSASSIDLSVTGGAVGQGPSGGWIVRNLQIRTNSVLTTVFSSSLQTVNVTGNATVDAGGAISVDGTGNGAASGPGAGATAFGSIVGGGGHGGFGAANPSGYGGAYDSIQSPAIAGSGGGNSNSGGGAGGGALRLAVTGTLAVNGRVSANGNNGIVNSGGGSGGSLWITAGTLAGSGAISANGGSGNGLGGGGGGGRISLGYSTSVFTGPVSAGGGGGYLGGGAGTIYTKASSQSVGQLLVNNGGLSGTNTPLSSVYGAPASPFNLTVGGGAIVCPQPSFPVLSNLTITAGSLLTSLAGQSNLDLVVLANVDVAAGGAIAVDANGFAQASGPGAGQSAGGSGSGAGYGGLGGAAATAAPGGTNYGSAQQPVDLGSGGGFGSGPLYGGSEGGGAIRLNVGGVLTVDGQLSANGDWGLQDNSGGGSGGSIWVTAGTLAGNGQITADGGEGELYGGGGGAGGRIALYSRANAFAGLVSVIGGAGDFQGANGSIFYSTNLPLQVLSHTPVGIVSNGVSFVELFFNGAPNPASFSGTDVSLMTPNGSLDPGTFSISMLSSSSYQVTFPLQTAVGNYTFTVGTNINDLYGQPMSQVYTGAFTISLPVIQGTVTDTNGQPVSGVLIQPDGGLSATTTDTHGDYALGIVSGWSGTVVPSAGNLVFAPGSRGYTNVTASVSNQNYVAAITIAPTVSAGLQATNLMMNWFGISGVTYQLYSSTNLVDWLPYGNAFPGTNGPVLLPIPINGEPMSFFRVQASN
ncbi:MAG: beta strand repeat-containing protein [Limisphaerales bacterium]